MGPQLDFKVGFKVLHLLGLSFEWHITVAYYNTNLTEM